MWQVLNLVRKDGLIDELPACRGCVCTFNRHKPHAAQPEAWPTEHHSIAPQVPLFGNCMHPPASVAEYCSSDALCCGASPSRLLACVHQATDIHSPDHDPCDVEANRCTRETQLMGSVRTQCICQASTRSQSACAWLGTNITPHDWDGTDGSGDQVPSYKAVLFFGLKCSSGLLWDQIEVPPYFLTCTNWVHL